MSTNMNVVLIPSTIGGSANKTSTNPLSFSVGLLTPENMKCLLGCRFMLFMLKEH